MMLFATMMLFAEMTQVEQIKLFAKCVLFAETMPVEKSCSFAKIKWICKNLLISYHSRCGL
jgi:hypothetical protein